jgi:hypothetical protein
VNLRSVRERGQATVELALALPVVVLFVLFVIQVALVVRDQILVLEAARSAAREAAVDSNLGRVSDAAQTDGLVRERLDISMRGRGAAGSQVRVELRYRELTDVPLVGPLLPSRDLHAAATMRVES